MRVSPRMTPKQDAKKQTRISQPEPGSPGRIVQARLSQPTLVGGICWTLKSRSGDSTGYTELGDKQPMQFWVQIGETRWRRQAGPAVSERKKRKEKRKRKRKGAGARFRFFIKPDKRDPRSATLAHVSRDQAKTRKLFKLSAETDTRSVRAL